MTTEARINLQKGVKEDKRYPATDYTSDGSFLDNYVISIARMKQNYREYRKKMLEQQELEKIGKQLEQQVEQLIDQEVKKIFQSLK